MTMKNRLDTRCRMAVFRAVILLGIVANITTSGKAQTEDPYGYVSAQKRTVYITTLIDTGNGVKPGKQATGFLVDKAGHILTVKHVVEPEWRHYLQDSNKWDYIRFLGRIGGPKAKERRLVPVQVYPGNEDVLLLKVHDAQINEEFEFFFLNDSDELLPAEVAISGYPKETDKMIRKTTTLDAPCTRGDVSCDINLKLEEGFSGSPVIWSDGTTVVGVLNKSTTRATDRSSFIHIARISGWLKQFAKLKTRTLPIGIPIHAPDFNKKLVCEIAQSGYIPLLSHKLLAIPKLNTQSSAVTKTRLVGDFIDGFNHLKHEPITAPNCAVTPVYAINPTTGTAADSIPLSFIETDVHWQTGIVIPPRPYSIQYADDSNVNITLPQELTLQVKNPTTIILDIKNHEFLKGLSGTAVSNSNLFLINEVLISDILSEHVLGNSTYLSESNPNPKALFQEDYRGLGYVVGVKLKHVNIARWPYSYSIYGPSDDLESGKFYSHYKELTHQEFRQDHRFFDIDKEGDQFLITFHQPFGTSLVRNTEVIILRDNSQVNGSTITVSKGRRRLSFFCLGGQNRLFSYNLELAPGSDGKLEPDPYQSFAVLMSWKNIDIESLLTYFDGAETERRVATVQSLSDVIFNLLTSRSQEAESLRNNPQRFLVVSRNLNNFANVDQETIARLESAVNQAISRELNSYQKDIIKNGQLLIDKYYDRKPVGRNFFIEDRKRTRARRKGSEMVGWFYATESLEENAFDFALEGINSAQENTLEDERKEFYQRFSVSIIYSQWQYEAALFQEMSAKGVPGDELQAQEQKVAASRMKLLDHVDKLQFPVSPSLSYVKLNWQGESVQEGHPPLPWIKTDYGETLKLASFFTDVEPLYGRSIKGLDPKHKTEFDKNSNTALIETNQSSIALIHAIKFDPRDFPSLAFDWAAHKLPIDGDVLVHAKDDQALQVIIAFEDTAGKLRNLNYIWDTSASEGTTQWRKAGLGEAKDDLNYLVIESGPFSSGSGWPKERRNFLKDVTTVFGQLHPSESVIPKMIRAVIVQSNSQWTRTNSRAEISEIVFSKSPIGDLDSLSENQAQQ